MTYAELTRIVANLISQHGHADLILKMAVAVDRETFTADPKDLSALNDAVHHLTIASDIMRRLEVATV